MAFIEIIIFINKAITHEWILFKAYFLRLNWIFLGSQSFFLTNISWVFSTGRLGIEQEWILFKVDFLKLIWIFLRFLSFFLAKISWVFIISNISYYDIILIIIDKLSKVFCENIRFCWENSKRSFVHLFCFRLKSKT